jgi:hypothetical protein
MQKLLTMQLKISLFINIYASLSFVGQITTKNLDFV